MLQAQNIHMRTATRSAQQRMMTIAIVAAFHVAVIATFIVALRPNWIPKLTPHETTVFVPPEAPTHPSPPTKPTLVDPTQPPITPPQWPREETNTNTTISNPPSNGGPGGDGQALPTRNPVALFSTHTTPPYPPLETRLGNEGNVLLRLTIDPDGEVAEADIVRSSGHDDLDQAAATWVKAHWRYLPALQSGQPVASTTTALVTFRLSSH